MQANKKRRRIDPSLRASVYILFAALSNLTIALEEVPEERNSDMEFLARELGTKLRIFYMNEKLHRDYQHDVTKVIKGMTGYETTNPAMLAISILVHYREFPRRKSNLSGLFWKTLYSLDGQVHDVEKAKLDKKYQALIDKSIEAGDLMVQGIVKYVGENYEQVR